MTPPRPPRGDAARRRGWMARLAAALPLLVAAVAIWRVLGPAILSPDSLAQYRQAVTGAYDDWHPPLLALLLHAVMRLGGGVGALMLAQTIAGLLGVQALASAWGAAWTSPGGASSGARPWLGLALALLLLLPFSPLPFYLVTFWKDSCGMVLFLWAMAVGTRLAAARDSMRDESVPPPPRARVSTTSAIAFAVLVALFALVRHNAVVLLPFAAGFVWLVAPVSRRAARLALALLPLALYGVGQVAIDRGAHVRHEHMERHLMVADMVGLTLRRPAALTAMPFLRARLLVPPSELHAYYQPGAMTGPAVSPAALGDPAGLRAAYLNAWRRFPLDLAAVKLGEMLGVAGVRETHLFIYFPQVEKNEYGLALWTAHAALRNAWAEATLATSLHPVGRLVFAAHWVWILVALGWLAAAWRRRRRALAVLLLLPLAYYASYALAAPAPDYRLMEPATMVVQCATLAALLARATRSVSRAQSRQAAASFAGSPRSTLPT